MRFATAAIVLAMAAGGWTAQDEDKIGKLSAPAALQKSLRTVSKATIVAISQKSEFAVGQQKTETQFDGVLKKDFAGVKGTQEVYAKGDKYLVKVGARYDPPSKILEPEGIQAASFKNPALILKELGMALRRAQYTADEDVDGERCALVVIQCDPRMVKMHLKELGDRITQSFKARAGNNGGGFFAEFFGGRDLFDQKASTSTFAVWIARKDLLIRKVEWIVDPVMKKNLPSPRLAALKFATRISVTFSKWDGDVPFVVPGVIKAKFRIR